MPSADTARLVAELSLDSKKFSAGMASANKSLGTMEKTLGRAGQGAKTFGKNIGLIGVAAAGGIAIAVKSGLNDLAELENSITSVDGAIEQLGLTGQLTGKQVADWANQIEADVDAAFDDKAITQAATTLLRFGKVTPKNLQKTLEVMTDLAAKTGDVDSAAELLAKALADPTKAAGRLTRQGIILTKQQQDQIKAMTEAGDIAGAQALVLDAVAKSTTGAAKAMAGPYQDAINKTNDAMEDARKALAIGFLPVITKVADKLSKIAADPKALASIEAFGKTLAGGLDHLISIAEKLPWDAIGTSMQIAGMGAKAVLDAFVALPPWVQTAVLTGWGLNKLTGGALTGIVGELGKGLIKGVLGMNAGVVHITAKSVTGVGGPGGPAAGAKPFLGLGAAAAGAAGAGVVILGVTQAAAADLTTAITGSSAAGAIQRGAGGGPVNIAGPLDRLIRGLQGDFRSGLEVTLPNKLIGHLDKLDAKTASRQNIANERLEAIKRISTTEQQAAFQIRDKLNGLSPIKASVDALKSAINATTAAARHAGQQSAAAIRDKDLSFKANVSVSVNNKVWVGETIKTQTTFKKLGGFVAS